MDPYARAALDLRGFLERFQDEVERRLDDFATSLQDFLHDLFNYPLERPWRQSLRQFYEHWIAHGLTITETSLAAIAARIESRLAPQAKIQSPINSPTGGQAPIAARTSGKPRDAAAPVAGPTQEEKIAAARQAMESYALWNARLDQVWLQLSDDQRRELERWYLLNLLHEAHGEPLLEEPKFLADGRALARKRFMEGDERSFIGGITPEEGQAWRLQWQRTHRSELTDKEREQLERIEEHERWERKRKEGFFRSFLNPANDGTGTLNDWAGIVAAFSGVSAAAAPGAPAMAAGRRPTPIRREPVRQPPNFAPPVFAKPPLPPPAFEVRVTNMRGRNYPHPYHVRAVEAEEQAAREIHDNPNHIVLWWGGKMGQHGADIISYNVPRRIVYLWDVKFRGGPVAIQPSTTFEKPQTLQYAVERALEVIEHSSLPESARQDALRSLDAGNYMTVTVGAGSAKNSTIKERK